MIIHILISIIIYLILMYLSVNLLGLFVRGLFLNPETEESKQEGNNFIENEIKKSKRADKIINIIALIVIFLYLYLLFYFWNIGMVIAVIIIMFGRLPGLLWDIKNGRKTDPKLMKKNIFYYTSAILPWVALPIIYYSLYYL